ncbi:MAG: hypothetical protein MI924_11305 [Chloroflexales bacterium]|nr:hypothetical protein [Chloroflexales bacterium]
MFTNRRQYRRIARAAHQPAHQPARRADASGCHVAPRRHRPAEAYIAGAVVLLGVFSAALGLVALCHGVSSCGTWPGSRCSAGRAFVCFNEYGFIISTYL